MSLSTDVFKGYTLVSDLGLEKYIFFRPTDSGVTETLDFWKSKGWEVKDVYTSDSLLDFLRYWFGFIRNLATDTKGDFNCARIRYWGTVCRELIDLMGDQDLDWVDLGFDGELFIHLNIIADNHKYCVLMED